LGEDLRDGLRLDRRGRRVALTRERADEHVGDAERGERRRVHGLDGRSSGRREGLGMGRGNGRRNTVEIHYSSTFGGETRARGRSACAPAAGRIISAANGRLGLTSRLTENETIDALDSPYAR